MNIHPPKMEQISAEREEPLAHLSLFVCRSRQNHSKADRPRQTSTEYMRSGRKGSWPFSPLRELIMRGVLGLCQLIHSNEELSGNRFLSKCGLLARGPALTEDLWRQKCSRYVFSIFVDL